MHRPLTAAAVVLLALGLAGCFNPFDPRVSVLRGATSPAPVPSSPANVVRLFTWCWQNRDAARYEEVFTDDYRFIFGPNDSSGFQRDRPWLREDEIGMAQHLFSGGADRPPASDVQITIDNVLVPLPDPRPGHLYKWHKTIRTHVDLKVTVTDASGTPSVIPVVGNALFYLVRGDSATVPKGFVQDSTRWWIERWEDETVGSSGTSARRAPVPGAGARPAAPADWYLPAITFGQLKVLYN